MTASFTIEQISSDQNLFLGDIVFPAEKTGQVGHYPLYVQRDSDRLTIWHVESKKLAEYLKQIGSSVTISHHWPTMQVRGRLHATLKNHASPLMGVKHIYRSAKP